MKRNVDFPGAGYSWHCIIYPVRAVLEDGTSWECDWTAMAAAISSESGFTPTVEQLKPGFVTNPNGTDRVRNALPEPVMLSE